MAKTPRVRVSTQGESKEEIAGKSSLSREEFCDRQHVTEDFDDIVNRQLLAPPSFHFAVQHDLAALNELLGLATGFGDSAEFQKLVEL